MYKDNENRDMKRLLPKKKMIRFRSDQKGADQQKKAYSTPFLVGEDFPCVHHMNISFFPFLKLEEPRKLV